MHWILATNRLDEKVAINLAAYRLMERTRLNEDGRPCTILLGSGLAAKLTGEIIDGSLIVMETPEELLAAPVIKKGVKFSREPEPLENKLLGADQVLGMGNGGGTV